MASLEEDGGSFSGDRYSLLRVDSPLYASISSYGSAKFISVSSDRVQCLLLALFLLLSEVC